MKNFWKITATIALSIVTSIGVMANEPVIKLAPTDDAQTLLLTLVSESPEWGETEIRLSDDENRILFDESVSATRYIKKFNLENLDFGTFQFAVENPVLSVIYTLRVSPGEVRITDREDRTIQPVFKKEGDKIYLNLLNTEQERVKIRIYDSSNRVVYKEDLKDEMTINKIFNFETAFEDQYRIVVKDGKDTYYKSITIG